MITLSLTVPSPGVKRDCRKKPDYYEKSTSTERDKRNCDVIISYASI